MKLLDRMRIRPLKRSAHERDEFIGSSFTSSRLVSEQILSWSGSNSRGRLFVMKFHSEWRNDNCPVMRWYAQQRETSTRFQVIEHRRNIDGPFYHEFLLLKLTDGAICRVERTGDGSRADALRYTGCTSNDMIQWFSVDDYDKFSDAMPSNIVAEIDLQQEFDILDVLAVCYSIRNTQACSVYTLQRYNCYFFCWTILAVLTRRLWETTVASDAWDSAVNSAMDHWSSVPPEEAKKHLMLRIYNLLEPTNPRATVQFLDPLRSDLSSNKLDLSVVNQAFGMTLWATSHESALRDGLALAASGAQETLSPDPGVRGAHTRRVEEVAREENLEKILSNHYLAQVYQESITAMWFRALKALSRAFSHQYQLMEVERPVPFLKLAQCRFFALMESLAILVGGTIDEQGWDFTDFPARNTLSGKLIYMRAAELIGRLKRLDDFVGDDRYEAIFRRGGEVIAAQQMADFLMAIYDTLEATHTLDPRIVATLHRDNCDPDDIDRYISSFATLALAPFLPGLVNSNQAQLRVKPVHQDKQSPADAPCTVEEFQNNYLRSCIRAHSKRVAAHQLAAAELVEIDVQDAMAKVWKSMPGEFRGPKKQDS